MGASPQTAEASGEDREAGDEHALGPDPVPERPRAEDEGGEGDRVGVDHPLQRADVAAQGGADRPDGDVDDADVELHDREPEAGGGQRQSAAMGVAGGHAHDRRSRNVQPQLKRSGGTLCEMLADADLSTVADLMTAHRATMLLALLGGRPLTAGELAGRAGISPSLASSHLSKLLDGGLVAVEQEGRRRHYRLADRRVAEVIEAMLTIAPEPGPRGPARVQARRGPARGAHLL